MAIRRFNFRAESDTKLNIAPDTIPTLAPEVPDLKDDANPYYKIQAIEYPTKGNGWNYLESFWESYVAKLNTRAFPGSKSGHSMQWGGRAPADFFVVGGMLKKNGDGTGTVYLKNYIPKMGETTANDRFIKLNQAGMIDYSIVARTKDAVYDDADGNRVCDCVESLGSERNDALDYGDGSMEMKTNAEYDFDLAETCIREGKISLKDNGTELFCDGKVSRPMLRRLVSHADGEEKTNIASLISMIDNTVKEKKKMNKEEILAALNGMKVNGSITLVEIAKSMGLEDQLKTNADTEAVAKYNSLKTVLGDNPESRAKSLIDAEKSAVEAKVNADIENIAGKKVNADGTANDLYEFAALKLNGKSGKDYDDALAALKTNSLFKSKASESADMTHQIIEGGENKPKQNAYEGTPSVTL